ncbi:hypothetical protein [Nocardia sp. CDC160]|uniref:hypothetical protein n=1 Tax=Nocardia sp. CDC160 TaxID=3112166 RepID=UPI002DB60EC5|nr:hypothetical protein [Nocardia sp. CDC160]MEC3919200.1 hypothetical protein [Nocardia sp. CDC160]
MIRVNRHIIAGALLGGAVLISAAPAEAQVMPMSTENSEFASSSADQVQTAAAPTAMGDAGIGSSGSADLNRWFCGSIWRPYCV